MKTKFIYILWVFVLILFVCYNIFYELNIIPLVFYIIGNALLLMDLIKNNKMNKN